MKYLISLLVTLSVFGCAKEKPCESLTGYVSVETQDTSFCMILQPYSSKNVRCAYPNAVSTWEFPIGVHIFDFQYSNRKWLDTIEIKACETIVYERRAK